MSTNIIDLYRKLTKITFQISLILTLSALLFSLVSFKSKSPLKISIVNYVCDHLRIVYIYDSNRQIVGQPPIDVYVCTVLYRLGTNKGCK